MRLRERLRVMFRGAPALPTLGQTVEVKIDACLLDLEVDAGYFEAHVNVNGILERDGCFPTQEKLDEWLDSIELELELAGESGAAFLIYHAHPLDVDLECTCVQYLQDHKPYRILNGDEADE